MLDISLLGTSGMMPLPDRWLSSMIARYNGKMILIDCGEGTQITLKLCGWGFKNIELICFTHYHADHISGLVGMLLAIGNSGRTEDINIIGPQGLKTIIKGLLVIAPELPFNINLIEFQSNGQMQYESDGYSILAASADHLIPCLAYKLSIPRKGKFDVNKANKLKLPIIYWNRLQNGETLEYEGKIFTPDMVLGSDRKGLSITYCTDTRPTDSIINLAKDSDLFICEGMYGEDEKKNKAIENKHMLFSEAAQIAKAANVKELWLTHFSPSLNKPEEFLNVAKKIFPNTIVGYDRISKTFKFDERD